MDTCFIKNILVRNVRLHGVTTQKDTAPIFLNIRYLYYVKFATLI